MSRGEGANVCGWNSLHIKFAYWGVLPQAKNLYGIFFWPAIDNYKAFTWQATQGRAGLHTSDLAHSQCITASKAALATITICIPSLRVSIQSFCVWW